MPRAIAPERLAEARKLIDEGKTRQEVSKLLSMSLKTLGKYFPYQPPVYDLEAWDKLLDQGYGYKHIGEMFGVCHGTVASFFPGRGWTREQISEHGTLIRNHNRKMNKVTYV